MRLITYTQGFEQLPVGTVVLDAYGDVYQRMGTYGTAHRGWLTIGSEIDVHHKEFRLPARVIYDPREKA